MTAPASWGITAVENAAQGVQLVLGVFDILGKGGGGRDGGNPGELKGALGCGHGYLRRMRVLWEWDSKWGKRGARVIDPR